MESILISIHPKLTLSSVNKPYVDWIGGPQYVFNTPCPATPASNHPHIYAHCQRQLINGPAPPAHWGLLWMSAIQLSQTSAWPHDVGRFPSSTIMTFAKFSVRWILFKYFNDFQCPCWGNTVWNSHFCMKQTPKTSKLFSQPANGAESERLRRVSFTCQHPTPRPFRYSWFPARQLSWLKTRLSKLYRGYIYIYIQ